MMEKSYVRRVLPSGETTMPSQTAKKLVEGDAVLAVQLALGKLSQEAYDLARSQLGTQRKNI